jgi:hypothetical protein
LSPYFDKRKKTNICSLFQIVCPTPHPSVIPFHNQTVWIPFKVDQIPEKEDFGIAKALASILKLIETVVMDTAFAEGQKQKQKRMNISFYLFI